MNYLRHKVLGNTKIGRVVIILMIVDSISLLASLALSFYLRFDSMLIVDIYRNEIVPHLPSLPLVLAIYLIAYHVCRLYRYAWRFASLEMVWGIIFANTIGLGGLIAAQSLVDGTIYPRSVLIIFWMISIIFIGS